ncbi:integumentary mucin C.1 isoform X3 [Eurytemora carolleeae]|uniref:integumentary mucin C.1 isoform X3 n=1 Tax=Eurytemora carolleeae TaxID=1294199 RepID=UPI000C77746A|nr:integumentary mucin C.1 isoform X3 [Eurytemora carolleeae]|eukprot:XP_023349367.1 integumentary mucin C.1-like isoform X3 [Eurytemora affinis]
MLNIMAIGQTTIAVHMKKVTGSMTTASMNTTLSTPSTESTTSSPTAADQCQYEITAKQFTISAPTNALCEYLILPGSGVCEVELEIEFIPKNRADCWQELVDIENYLFCGEEPKTKLSLSLPLDKYWNIKYSRESGFQGFRNIQGTQILCADAGYTEDPDFRTLRPTTIDTTTEFLTSTTTTTSTTGTLTTTTTPTSTLTITTGVSSTTSTSDDYLYDYENVPTPARF